MICDFAAAVFAVISRMITERDFNMWWKKAIPTVIAIVLIIIIGSTSYKNYVKETYGGKSGEVTKEDYLRFLPKYRYNTSMMDLYEYYTIYNDDEVPLVIAGVPTMDYAKLKDGKVYFDIDLVKKYITNRFYYNEVEHRLLYTTVDSVYKTATDGKSLVKVASEEAEEAKPLEGTTVPAPGTAKEDVIQGYQVGDVFYQTDYCIAYEEDDKVYVALDYLKKFGTFGYELLTEPNRLVFRTESETYKTVSVTDDTEVRVKEGIKADILKEVKSGDTLILVEKGSEWTKVMTEDALVGYIKAEYVKDKSSVTYNVYAKEVEDGYEPILLDHKISMAYHQCWAAQGPNGLKEVTTGVSGINVICPTWFRFKDNTGALTNISNKNYVKKAHEMGLDVWAMLTDLDTEGIDLYAILAYEEKRAQIIETMVSTVKEYGADGINVDVENVKLASSEHFVQFLRELSIATHREGIILSVDDYFPTESNKYYNIAEQGIVCDYVVTMGYDEHWGGSGSAGSVASIGFVRDGLSAVIEKVPANQVINGVPFYTRVWYTTGGVTTDELLTMINTQSWLDKRALKPEWDAVTCQYYVDFKQGETRYQCWIEDAESIQMKMQIMDNKGVAGVAAWKLTQEDPSVWKVFEAYLGTTE